MIIASSTQQANRIADFVQTLLNINNEDDLHIISVEPNVNGFFIVYTQYLYDEWVRDSMQLWNSQMILLSTFIKNEQ